MKRKIVQIDEEKCNGCGLCIDACHEGALQLVDGKARLVSESYCDGLGDCLPECPADAITIEEREALPFDEEAVKQYMEAQQETAEDTACGCPGTTVQLITPGPSLINLPDSPTMGQSASDSQLRQWPCQIKLVPVNASYFDNADLLIAADCTAYAYPNIHNDYLKNRITLIGCPKLDDVEYANKLTQILSQHELKSITVLRMEVPCCTGLVNSVKKAIKESGQIVPWSIVTISTDGRVLE